MRFRDPKLSLAAVFIFFGMASTSWVSRAPIIKQRLDLSDGQLSLALLGLPVGLLIAMQVVGWLVARRSSATVLRAGMAAVCLLMWLPTVAGGLMTLTVVLLALGIALGALDISMNTQALALQRMRGKSLMSAIHGFFSVGVLGASALGSVAARLEIEPVVQCTAVAVALAVVAWLASPSLLGREADIAPDEHVESAEAEPMRLWRRPLLVLIGLITACGFFAEGAVENWSSVFLFDSRGAGQSVAALGPGACAVGMGVARFLADPVIDRLGPRGVLWRTSCLSAAGMALVLLAPSPTSAVACLVVVGVGLATIVPICFSLTSEARGVPPAWAISRVTTIGYAGLLGSPPIIGAVAHLTSLSVALWLVAMMLALIVPMTVPLRSARAPMAGARLEPAEDA